MIALFLNRSLRHKIIVSFILSFVFSHLLVTYVFFTDQPVVRASFKQQLSETRFNLALTFYQLRYRLAELPRKLAFIPSTSPRLPAPWYFVPPPEWLAPPSGSGKQPSAPGGKPPPFKRPTRSPPPVLPTATPVRGTQPTRAPVVPPAPTVTPVPYIPPATPTTAPGNSPGQEASKLLSLINNERRGRGIGELKFDDRLNRAAQNYADIIGPAGVCSHTYGSTLVERYQQVGYPSSGGGENITCGISSPQAAFDAWMGSSGHRANMLNSNWKSAGLGFSSGYWVLDLGRE